MPIRIIYKHINKINGKVYIGQTSKTMMERWKSGTGYRQNKHFDFAIKKYGKENFSHEVLTFCGTQEAADQLEIYFIAKYDSTNKGKGYNKSLGGESSHLLSEEAKSVKRRYTPEEEVLIAKEYSQKPISTNNFAKLYKYDSKSMLSLLKRNSTHIWTRNEFPKQEFSVETRKKMSKKRLGKKPANKGKKTGIVPWNKDKTNVYSDETKKLMSESKKGKSPANKIQWTDEQMKDILDLSISSHKLAKKYGCSKNIFLRIRKEKNE